MRRLICFILFLTSCCPLQTAEFVDVVHAHRELTVETLDAVISSISDEIAELKEKNELTLEEEDYMNDLILRLEIISRESVAISDYVDGNLDVHDWSDLFKHAWE